MATGLDGDLVGTVQGVVLPATSDAEHGDRYGSVRHKRPFWLNRSAAWNMTRSVFRIYQTKRSRPHSMDRPGREAQRLDGSGPPALGLADPGLVPFRRRPPGETGCGRPPTASLRPTSRLRSSGTRGDLGDRGLGHPELEEVPDRASQVLRGGPLSLKLLARARVPPGRLRGSERPPLARQGTLVSRWAVVRPLTAFPAAMCRASLQMASHGLGR